MLIIDKILNKKTVNLSPKKVMDRSICFEFDDGSKFLTVEELTSDSYVLFVDDHFLNNLNHLLGIDHSKLSFDIFEWFKRKYEIKTMEDIGRFYK